MGNTQLSAYQRFPFVDAPQEHVAEEDGPDPIVDLFEADAMLPQRRGQIEQAGLEAHSAGIGHALHQKMVRILERGQRPRVGAGRWTIARARCAFRPT